MERCFINWGDGGEALSPQDYILKGNNSNSIPFFVVTRRVSARNNCVSMRFLNLQLVLGMLSVLHICLQCTIQSKTSFFLPPVSGPYLLCSENNDPLAYWCLLIYLYVELLHPPPTCTSMRYKRSTLKYEQTQAFSQSPGLYNCIWWYE